MRLLDAKKITKSYGGVIALADVDIFIQKGEIVGLIGPNGAGKTTLFNIITGLTKPTSGQLNFGNDQRSIVGLKPDKITHYGISRTFQNIRLFMNLSVIDNVKIGRHCRTKNDLFGAIFQTSYAKREEAEITSSSRRYLDFVELLRYENEFARNLSYGDQRRLEIARALAAEPTLLLLDEPAAGMNPSETYQLTELIRQIRDLGIAVFLIEHDMKAVMGISDRVIVLDYGIKIAEGNPEEIQHNKTVIEAYLGK